MKFKGWVIFILFFVCVMACKKNTTNPTVAYFRFLQAVPATKMDISLNYGTPLVKGAGYDSLSPYFNTASGAIRIQLTNDSANATLLDAILTLSPGIYYTFIASNTAGNVTPTLIIDNGVTLTTDSTFAVRLLHLSDSTGTVNMVFYDTLAINDTMPSLDSVDTIHVFSYRTFNDQYTTSYANYYVPIYYPNTLSFHIINVADSTLVTSTPYFNYVGGKSYTLVLYNTSSPSGDHTADVSIHIDDQ